jgi:hypothetical protein
VGKFSHSTCHGIPQMPLIRLLPGLTDATPLLNSRPCITQMASYHPQRFLVPYGYRGLPSKVNPRTNITPCVWLGPFVLSQNGFMWRCCTCTFQRSVIPFLVFFFGVLYSWTCGVAGPAWTIPMDSCNTGVFKKYDISVPAT